MQKCQAAFDYMMIAAFSLVLIVPVFYYAITYSNESIISAQAQDSVNTLAKASDNTYALGEGSLTRIQVNIPVGVDSINISSNSIVMKITTSAGSSDIVGVTRAPVSGSLSKSPGSYFVILNNTGPFINISEAS